MFGKRWNQLITGFEEDLVSRSILIKLIYLEEMVLFSMKSVQIKIVASATDNEEQTKWYEYFACC